MALPDAAREAFVVGLVATVLVAVSALAGLASWALYRIEREEAGQGADIGRRSFER
jgi:uncharacterized membrane-anchored protein